MSFPSIINRGEFFSNHYLDAIIGGDLNDLRSSWEEAEKTGESARSRVKQMGAEFFKLRAKAAEAHGTQHGDAVRQLNALVLTSLGFDADPKTIDLKRNTVDLVEVDVAASVDTSAGLLLVALNAGFADSVDDLFDEGATTDNPAGLLLDRVWLPSEKKQVTEAAKAIGEVFSCDDPPRFVLLMGGRVLLLAERAKWAEGRYLAVDLDAALERNDARAKGELETIAALFSADALVPGSAGDSGQSLIDELVDKSTKHAVGVSKELRTGIRESIELLANEVVDQRWKRSQERHDKRLSSEEAPELTKQCLRYLYRLLVLLYAESRPELGILPVDDQSYMEGYSLDRLRELSQVNLDTEQARNGSHIHESLTLLFELVNNGYHAEHAEQTLIFDAPDDVSLEEYLQFPGLDAALFDPKSTHLLEDVTLRNEVLQRVLDKLMRAPGKKRNDAAGFISYAQLGINQLGAVYEGLMSYTGFFADEDLYEVAKGGDPKDGTWVLPVHKADEYPDDVFVTRKHPTTGKEERVLHRKNSFVYRLSGRDRQRSASYYTPEVLTRCVVKHALAELLGLDDYAPEHGSSCIKPGESHKLLDLTICEPALGSGAFANEAINQLAAEYLRRAQAEQGETLDPERYAFELQKVKAHFALHQTYGVDLNSTAVELAEVSLWLNAMYPGLKAPWFGLQLRQGNSLIGCRRATWTASQIQDKPWAKTKKGEVTPPIDLKLNEGLLATDGDNAEIHHFLFPAHGWAAVADRKEAKELRPDEVEALKAWRKTILAAPKKTDAKRLTALSKAVEDLWASSTERIQLIQQDIRRPIDIYGIDEPGRQPTTSRAQAEKALQDPDSPLGRLRTLMDAWVGLWFWPLDTGTTPPSWEQWLTAAEELARPDEKHGPEGQLDLFDDLASLLEAQQRLSFGQTTVAELREQHPWLDIALNAASREGAWHWDLEFAPAFAANGGFDLQVGNPPWVRPRWLEDTVLAELDPWWGIAEKPSTSVRKARRSDNIAIEANQDWYLRELTSAEGVGEILGSPIERPVLTGVQTNLYMVFMDTVWRHQASEGAAALLHPESHFVDPKGAALRRTTYRRLRRHWHFTNEAFLFEEVHHSTDFSINVYGEESQPLFLQAVHLLDPSTLEHSLNHDGSGEIPGLQHSAGGWDTRPHLERLLRVDTGVLASWALFDDSGSDLTKTKLLRPLTRTGNEILQAIAGSREKLGQVEHYWTAGFHEKEQKEDGTLTNYTYRPDSLQEVILQGPHIENATPVAKEPKEVCRHSGDWESLDLESMPRNFVPRTNYRILVHHESPMSRLPWWDGAPYFDRYRAVHREFVGSTAERTLQNALAPPGPPVAGSLVAIAVASNLETCLWSGLASTLPFDYVVKVMGVGHVKQYVSNALPFPRVEELEPLVLLRTLRLNCQTAHYSALWSELWDLGWLGDRWTDQSLGLNELGAIRASWTVDTPLRIEIGRRLALVELDALAALMLGLTAEQLCAMYRTQFAVLRKYEYKMAFDSEGRKICAYHQSAGYRQSELQARAKAKELPKEWEKIWAMYEQYEEDPESVDWRGHYTPPFTRPDREFEMTRAYNEFQRRLDAGEYGVG